MIAYIDSNGKIIGGVYAKSPDDLNGITRIPDGCTAVYISDTTYPNVWTDMGAYKIVNGAPVTRTYTQAELDAQLADAKSQKIAEITAAYGAACTSGFTSSATGTSHTYYGDIGSQIKFSGQLHLFTLDSTITSVDWATSDAGMVTHTKDELIAIYKDGAAYERDQRTKFDGLIAQVNAATTVDAVNAVVW